VFVRNKLLALLLVFGIVGAACSSSQDTTTANNDAATPTTAASTATATPGDRSGDDAEDVDESADGAADEALIAEIEAEIDAWMAEGEVAVPGITLTVLLPEDQDMRIARGVADLETGEPVSADDYFRIGSVSKAITSVAMLQLADEGLVDLDEPVATYLGDGWLTGYELDGVDYGESVTVRQLLNHTDGFAEFAWDPGFYAQAVPRLDVEFEPHELLEWATARGPQFTPGTDYNYNTVGHIAAGLIIEAVTGSPAHEVLGARIFDPLGLDNIYLPPAEQTPVPVVHGYAVGELKGVLDVLLADTEYADAGVTGAAGEYLDILSVPQEAITSAGWTGGGMAAQSVAMAEIFRAMFDGTLLSDAMVTEFTTTVPDTQYGLGIGVAESLGHVAYSHGGGVPGFRSHAVYYPDLDIAIAMSLNAIPVTPDADELAERILKILTA